MAVPCVGRCEFQAPLPAERQSAGWDRLNWDINSEAVTRPGNASLPWFGRYGEPTFPSPIERLPRRPPGCWNTPGRTADSRGQPAVREAKRLAAGQQGRAATALSGKRSMALRPVISTSSRWARRLQPGPTGAGPPEQAAGQRQRLEGGAGLAGAGPTREILVCHQTDAFEGAESIRSFSLPDRTAGE